MACVGSIRKWRGAWWREFRHRSRTGKNLMLGIGPMDDRIRTAVGRPQHGDNESTGHGRILYLTYCSRRPHHGEADDCKPLQTLMVARLCLTASRFSRPSWNFLGPKRCQAHAGSPSANITRRDSPSSWRPLEASAPGLVPNTDQGLFAAATAPPLSAVAFG
jgi:hypothetical protein